MKPAVALASRLLAGGTFAAAGLLKALDPAQFARDVDHYRILPYFAAAPVALYLPYLEIVCGLAVFVPALRRGAAAVLLAAATLFILALGSAWARGLDIRCGCFGAAAGGPLPRELAFDLLLAAALAVVLRAESAAKPARPAGG